MKITNLKSGIPYQLKPGTQLEVERTNPFFNEYGEQTLPLEIPDTDSNRIALGYPHLLGNDKKQTDISALIEDGDYYAICKQAILSAQRKGSISTSFYMNQGSFYSSMQKTDLKAIFEGETVPGVQTVEQAINFCRSLRTNQHEIFAIFPVLIKNDNDSTEEKGSIKYKYINRWGYWVGRPTPTFHDGSKEGLESDFYNAQQQMETIDSVEISIPSGYYISPFIRTYYVLQRIFLYFGYTLLNSFFDIYPFDKMVFINNVADTLVNGPILISQLVPDVKCNDIINLFRHKFCCEFIVDEIEKTVSIELFNDVAIASPEMDLTKFLVGNYTIEYPERYKQLKLTSKYEIDNEVTESFESLSMLLSKYPLACFKKSDGIFAKIGFSLRGKEYIKLTESSTPYYAGGSYETHEIEVEECIPDFRYINSFIKYLYIGDYQMLNSKIIKNNSTQSTEGENKEITPSDNIGLYLMLAFPFVSESNVPLGTVTDYGYDLYQYGNRWRFDSGKRIFDYSLCYYGENGIFEKFYRTLDTLLRNSLHTVRGELLLSKSQKRLLLAHKKYILDNQEVFINKLSFNIGGSSEPKESELLTMKLYAPTTRSPHLHEVVTNWDTGYYWELKTSSSTITEAEYNSSPYPKLTDSDGSNSVLYDLIFPEPPTAADSLKDKCYEVKYVSTRKNRDNSIIYLLISKYLLALPLE